MPTQSSETIELWLDELVALGQALGYTIPASLTTIVGRMKPNPIPSFPTAQQRMQAKVQAALKARSFEPRPV